MLRDAAPLPRVLTNRQLMLAVLTKQPSLQEHFQCLEDEHTPDSVMAQTWMALHDALPPSESGLRDQLMLRASPTASIEAQLMRPEHANSTDENRTSCKQPRQDQEEDAELESICDAAWPCSSLQYGRKLSKLRATTSLAAQRPESALKELADDRTLLSKSPSHAEAFACITTEAEAALARCVIEEHFKIEEHCELAKCVIEEHFKIEERQVLLATPEAWRAPQGSKLGSWWRRSR